MVGIFSREGVSFDVAGVAELSMCTSERSAVHRPADTVPTLPKFLDDEELAHFG